MVWFFWAFLCCLCWGFGDLFYKIGSDRKDRTAHIKFIVWSGIVMGLCSLLFLPLSESGAPLKILIEYPAFTFIVLLYVFSLIVSVIGMRYLEASVISPLENTTGAFSGIAIALILLSTDKFSDIFQEFLPLDIIGTIIIVLGMVALGFEEHQLSIKQNEILPDGSKKRLGAKALIFPIAYCLLDAGTVIGEGVFLYGADGIGEFDYIILEGLIFAASGIVAWLYLVFAKKIVYNPFKKSEMPKASAGLLETIGNVFFALAMGKNPVLGAPLCASYCIVTMIASRIFLKEKLAKLQYIFLIVVIIGIILLGISEGLGSM